MLLSLKIKNYALIESLHINFQEGFTVITGETGAGKSILLGALSLVLGKRADSSLLNNSTKKCIIEAEFNIGKLSLLPLFEKYDIDYDINSIFRREILPSGKSRAFINDTPVNLSSMKDMSERLLDIHSQHQTLWLGKTSFQLKLFDSFINDPMSISDYQTTYYKYIELKNTFNRLKYEKELADKEEDFLRYQLDELETTSEYISNFEKLKEEEELLNHAEEIANGVGLSINLLAENDLSVLQQMAKVKEALLKTSSYHKGLKNIYQRIESLLIELKDIISELESIGSNISFNPALVSELNEKLDAVYRLQKKHHVTNPEDLWQIKSEIETQLEKIEFVDNKLEEIKKQFIIEEQHLLQKAKNLTLLRKKHISAFEKKITNLLNRLGMPHARLKVMIENADSLTEWGTDKVSFLFSANKGIAPEDINKIASGGELSRLMLALKAMIQQRKVLPTIIFDEIDSGVSGEIAGKTGNVLLEMSKKLQVIAITHLPQIAAKANYHLKVYKENFHGKTTSNLILLSDEQRIQELAKLISDKNVTPAAFETAKNLLYS